MIILAWVLTIAMAVYVGYEFKKVKLSLKELEERLKSKVEKKDAVKVKSSLVDIDDPIQQMRRQHEENMRRLNP